MRGFPSLLIVVVLLMSGCGGHITIPPRSADHPASADAPEGTYIWTAAALKEDPQDELRTASRAPGQGATHNNDAEKGMEDQPQTMPAHGGHQGGGEAGQPPASGGKYVCPMHAQIVRNEPGKCPICGMKLVEKKAPQ